MKLEFIGTRGEIAVRRRGHWRHSALIVSHAGSRVLVDCGADWIDLLPRLRPHAIVITHAHPDHVGGLARGAPCAVWATKACWKSIGRYPIAEQRVITTGRATRIDGLRFTAFSVEHSIRAPAVGYRIAAGRLSVFYAPDLVFIRRRSAALRGLRYYIGDGASLTRPIVRHRDGRQIGHASIATQLAWCREEGVGRALITHCGSGLVRAAPAEAARSIHDLGQAFGVRAEIAVDGMTCIVR